MSWQDASFSLSQSSYGMVSCYGMTSRVLCMLVYGIVHFHIDLNEYYDYPDHP